MRPRFRVDLREAAGAFGDLGTSLPLLVGMVAVAGLDGAHVFFVFGGMQFFSAVFYGVPIPAQPLKVIAALTIAQGLAPELILGAGVAMGGAMLLLTVTGLVDRLARAVPTCVVRGVQFGLGLQLMLVAMRYLGAGGMAGVPLVVVCLGLVVLLRDNRRMPPALLIVGLGLGYGVLANGGIPFPAGMGLSLPRFQAVRPGAVLEGFLVLGIAQLPLSLSNAVLATERLAADFYPERRISARRIGLGYSFMNLVAPFFGGVPMCHGATGTMGMRIFGGRTGAATVLYGAFFLVVAVVLGQNPAAVSTLFPLPVLGTLLLAQAVGMAGLVREPGPGRNDVAVAVAVGLCAALLPYGYLLGLAGGTVLVRVLERRHVSGVPMPGNRPNPEVLS